MPLEDNVQIEATRHALASVERVLTAAKSAQADLAAALDILKEIQESERETEYQERTAWSFEHDYVP